MATLLRNLRIKRVDLVDAGASYDVETGQGAHAVLYKRDGMDGEMRCKACGYMNKSGAKTCAKCDAPMMKAATEPQGGRMDELKAQIAKLEADLKAAEALADEEQKKRETAEKRATDAEKALNDAKNTPEEIEKRRLAELPESVRKQLKEQAETIEKLKDAAELSEYAEKAKGFGLVAENASLLRKIAKALSKEEYESFETLLKAKDAQAAAGKRMLFKIAGKDDQPVNDNPTEKFNSLVEAEKKADPKLSHVDAISKVAKSHPDLYRDHTEAVRAAK